MFYIKSFKIFYDNPIERISEVFKIDRLVVNNILIRVHKILCKSIVKRRDFLSLEPSKNFNVSIDMLDVIDKY